MIGPGITTISATRSWKSFLHLREVLLVVAAYFTYMYVRKLILTDVSTAFDNADRIVSLERGLGIFWEPIWQGWALDTASGVVLFFNWVYIFTFWPIILTTAVVLYIVDRRRYVFFRNVILVSFLVALLIFAAFPLAPPRMLPDVVDTIKAFGPGFYASRELANYYNAFAAMPSLHFAWTLIFGYMFVRTRWMPVRIFGVLYPTMTFMAITVTGNHYIMDALGGGLVMVSSLSVIYAAQSISRRRQLRSDATA